MNTAEINHKYVKMAQDVSTRLSVLDEEKESEILTCSAEIYNWNERLNRVQNMQSRISSDTPELNQLVEIAKFQIDKWTNKKEKSVNERATLSEMLRRAGTFNATFEISSINRTIALMSGMGTDDAVVAADPAKEIEALRAAVFELAGYKEIM